MTPFLTLDKGLKYRSTVEKMLSFHSFEFICHITCPKTRWMKMQSCPKAGTRAKNWTACFGVKLFDIPGMRCLKFCCWQPVISNVYEQYLNDEICKNTFSPGKLIIHPGGCIQSTWVYNTSRWRYIYIQVDVSHV